MDFIPSQVSDYAEKHTSEQSTLLQKIDRITNEQFLMPRMLSGHLQGRLLAMISKMVSPKRILEIGTYTGYSALCLAEGLTRDGKIITIDLNKELEVRVNEFFEESAYRDQIDFRIGQALDIIPRLDDSFDLVFIDADKLNYSAYYDLVMPKLNPSGIIIADNVLWSGKVLEETEYNDEDTAGLRSFNEKVTNDPRVENVLIPVRDGLMVARKIP